MSDYSKEQYQAHVWLDSCRKFVVTCEQQLAQAKQQLEKAEERVKGTESTPEPSARG